MADLPIVLIHGYSDVGSSFLKWKQILLANGYREDQVHTCSYRSLTNEITVADIAEGLERALRGRPGISGSEPFDTIVHSTGMLVLRKWMARSTANRKRVKHIIGLAPATFGSPLAHQGRSWIGSLVKGTKDLGPDFLESGDQVLDALELGSRFTWDLAHEDLAGKRECYGHDDNVPWVFTFCGVKGYGGLRSFLSEPGTDGTVRLAGVPLNSQKFTVDASGRRTASAKVNTHGFGGFPLWAVPKLNHGTILTDPDTVPGFVNAVLEALRVSSSALYQQWTSRPDVKSLAAEGDPIRDFHIEIVSLAEGATFAGRRDPLRNVTLHQHSYSSDSAFRSYMIDLNSLKNVKANLALRVIASTGTEDVTYTGSQYEDEVLGVPDTRQKVPWSASIDLPEPESNDEATFFYPYTTTLVELILNREPNPLEANDNRVVAFPAKDNNK